MTVWPQIIFDEDGPQLRSDAEEIYQFGSDNFQAVFFKHLKAAFRTLDYAKRPRLLFEKLNAPIPSVYRYPPRIFANRRIRDFDNRMHFRCRHLKPADKRRVLQQLANLDDSRNWRGMDIRRGSGLPFFHTRLEPADIVRGFVKIGLNLLRYACRDMNVGRSNFLKAVQVVLAERPVPARVLATNGFVHPEDIRFLDCPTRCHKFRLEYDSRAWTVSCAFFSGQTGATITFPGPNHEQWRMVDITVPVGSPDWEQSNKLSIVIPRPSRFRLAWTDLTKILPSMPFTNVQSALTLFPVSTPERGAKNG